MDAIGKTGKIILYPKRRDTRKREDNIRMDLTEIGWGRSGLD